MKKFLTVSFLIGCTACGSSSPSAPSSPPATTPTTAQTRVIALSGSLAFGNVQVGGQPTLTFTIANTGNATLTISGVSITTGLSVFAANWTSGTIAAGSSQTVTVQFVPTAAQTYSGTISINGDQTSGTSTIAVSGTGTSTPCATLSPPSASITAWGNGFHFAVMPAAGDCTWTVSTTDAWIHGVAPTSGVGSATVSYSVDDNVQTTAPRLGSILVAWAGGGTRFTINQAGATCTPSETFQEPAAGDKWILGIGAGCYLNTTYASDASWLYGGSTAGGVSLSIFVDPNPGAPRTGHITMSGRNGNGLYAQYTFVQAGQ
jgi:HYDIN/CFA65/VesB family protein/all-beta uncharacterized protein